VLHETPRGRGNRERVSQFRAWAIFGKSRNPGVIPVSQHSETVKRRNIELLAQIIQIRRYGNHCYARGHKTDEKNSSALLYCSASILRDRMAGIGGAWHRLYRLAGSPK
jgi:hypothetical protein